MEKVSATVATAKPLLVGLFLESDVPYRSQALNQAPSFAPAKPQRCPHWRPGPRPQPSSSSYPSSCTLGTDTKCRLRNVRGCSGCSTNIVSLYHSSEL
jgi:hypothetical protein